MDKRYSNYPVIQATNVVLHNTSSVRHKLYFIEDNIQQSANEKKKKIIMMKLVVVHDSILTTTQVLIRTRGN